MKTVEGIMLISYGKATPRLGLPKVLFLFPIPFLFLHFVQLSYRYVSCFPKQPRKRKQKENVAEK